MITIAIVEDEEAYAKQLTEYIEQYQQESGKRFRVIRFTDGDEIVEKYTGEYDIILMDIQMQFMDGMTAAEEIRKFDTKVVIMFITNMTNYAIRGYEVDAMDYVLKPVTYFSFARKLERAISRIPQKTGKPVKVNTPDGVVRIDAGDVYYIESEGHNLIYHTSNGTLKERAKMQDAAGMLVLQTGWLMLTGTVSTLFWIPCMIIAIGMMFLFLWMVIEATWKMVAYCCMKAFLTAEFMASLEWQLEYFAYRGRTEKGVLSILTLAIVYGAVTMILWIIESRMKRDEIELEISVKELYSTLLIVLSAFMLSN